MTLSVADRGPGVTPAQRSALFERGTRSAETGGAGLGLFVARRLMAEQGGALWFEPRPGGGLAVFDGWGDWMDMGSTPGGEDKYFDLVAMTRRGHQQVKAAVDLLAQRSYDATPLLTGGLQMGPCYYYSFEKLQAFRYA